MHRKIGTAIVALVLFAGPSTVSFAQSSSISGGANPTGEGIGGTSSIHNPRPTANRHLLPAPLHRLEKHCLGQI